MTPLRMKMKCFLTKASIFISKIVPLNFKIFMFLILSSEGVSFATNNEREALTTTVKGEKLLPWSFGSDSTPPEGLMNPDGEEEKPGGI